MTGPLANALTIMLMLEIWVQSRLSHTKDSKKKYLMPPCLTLSIKYGSRVNWSNPGKGAFGLPSTTVANFTCICSGNILQDHEYGTSLVHRVGNILPVRPHEFGKY